jgi:hypothetical protein
MKNLIIALNAAAQEADNIVGKTNNSAKGTVYADTPRVINALKPVLKRHGLSFHILPSVASGQNIISTDKSGASFNEFSGTQSVRIVVTHSSGEIWDAGEASMPLNIQNKGMTSLDKAMGVLTVLTRKSWLGLLGVVEVDSVEKTMHGISEQEEQDERVLSSAIDALKKCESYEQMKPIVNSACKLLSREAQTALIKIASEIKANLGG